MSHDGSHDEYGKTVYRPYSSYINSIENLIENLIETLLSSLY